MAIACVMPVYNCAAVIEIGIRSVLDQDIEDWQLIIVDDSTDETPAVVRKLTDGDPRVLHVQLSAWRCIARKRDLGVMLSGCEWIAQWDCDNYCPPCRLRVQLEAVQAEPLTVCHVPFVQFAAPLLSDEVWELRQNTHPLQLGCGATFLYSRELWWRMRGHDTGMVKGEDRHFASRVQAVGGESIAAPSEFSQRFLGFEHGGNVYSGRVGKSTYGPTGLRWQEMVPGWVRDIFDGLKAERART